MPLNRQLLGRMFWLQSSIARFRGSEFAKDTAILTSGTAAAQLVTIAAMPVMARLYTPADFGVLAIFLAVSGIVATSITMRYETSILLPKEESESTSLVLLSFGLAITLGLVVGITVCLLPEKVRVMLGVSALGGWLPIAVLAGMATAVIAIGTAWFNRHRLYIKIAQLRITQVGVGAICGITFGIYGYSTGLLMAQVVALLLVTIVVVTALSGMNAHCHGQALRNVAKKHSAAPKYLLPTALLDVITMQLPVLLITAWFSSEAAGQFSMAWKILALPMALMGGAVGQVFLQKFSQVWPDAQSARRLLFRTWKILALVGGGPTILIMIFGEQLFIWILGDAWGGAGKMAAAMAPMLMAMLISSPTSGTFLVLRMQKHSLFFGIAVLIYRPICLLIGLVTGQLIHGLLILTIVETLQISLYQFLVVKKLNTTT